jgi:hypothetical protein
MDYRKQSSQLFASLFPVRSHVGADHAAFRADHARPELAHQEIARVPVDLEAHLVAAAKAHDQKRAHAVLAHVGEVHWLDFVLGRQGAIGHHSASRARIIAGLSGFFTLIQSRDGPDLGACPAGQQRSDRG